MCKPNRHIVFFIDGGTWTLLDPWIEAGHLPNFARLKKEGASGKLASVIPTETSFATGAFAIGKNPGRIGIFKFSDFSKVMFTSDVFPGERLWEVLSDGGKRSLVMDLPSTWPPRPFNGTLFTGFFTPSENADFVYPRERDKEFFDYPRGGVEVLKYLARGQDLNALRTAEFEITTKRFETFYKLWTREDYDFGIFYVKATDILQHYFWNDNELLLRFYRLLDGYIGQLRSLPSTDNFWVISDHGFDVAPMTSFYINAFLAKRGYLRFRGWKAATGLGRWLKNFLEQHRQLARRYYRLQKMFSPHSIFSRMAAEIDNNHEMAELKAITMNQLRPAVIDFEQTTAYAAGGLLHGKGIYLNLSKLKTEEGRERLINRLRDDLSKLVYKGKPAIIFIKSGQEVYGRHPDVPDLVFLPQPELFVDDLPSSNIFAPRQTDSRATGHHLNSLYGIFMASGSMIRPGQYDNLKLIDVFPTILASFGQNPPADIDGRVMTDILTTIKLADHVMVSEDINHLIEDIEI